MSPWAPSQQPTEDPILRRSANPRVTIGVPVYNGERFLAQCLDSLVAQTYRNFEVIISDNASTDGTRTIAEAYAARDTRIRYVRQPRNQGVAANFQCLVDLAQGEFFRWAAADDSGAPQLLERCIAALDDNPDAVLAYPKTRIIDEAGRAVEDYEDRLELSSELPSERFRECYARLRQCNAQYGVIRTGVLRRTGGQRSYPSSDIVLLAELALHGRFVEVPERLFYRRFHSSMTTKNRGTALQDIYNPGRKHADFMYEWRHLWELWLVLGRVPIPLREKVRVARQLLLRARWNRHVLARELWGARRRLTYRLGQRQAAV